MFYLINLKLVLNSSANSLYRLKVAAITEASLESPWTALHTLVPPAAVFFNLVSGALFRIAWQATLPPNSAEIGYIARLCTRRINVSETFTCSRVAGSAVGCDTGLPVPSSVDLVSGISLFDTTLALFGSMIWLQSMTFSIC
jgi:hypothetical protein